jgi:hypothetical protein
VKSKVVMMDNTRILRTGACGWRLWVHNEPCLQVQFKRETMTRFVHPLHDQGTTSTALVQEVHVWIQKLHYSPERANKVLPEWIV